MTLRIPHGGQPVGDHDMGVRALVPDASARTRAGRSCPSPMAAVIMRTRGPDWGDFSYRRPRRGRARARTVDAIAQPGRVRPSSNTWPRWPPQFEHTTYVRACELASRSVSTVRRGGLVEARQPVPESNFVSETKSSAPQPAQRKVPFSFASLKARSSTGARFPCPAAPRTARASARRATPRLSCSSWPAWQPPVSASV